MALEANLLNDDEIDITAKKDDAGNWTVTIVGLNFDEMTLAVSLISNMWGTLPDEDITITADGMVL